MSEVFADPPPEPEVLVNSFIRRGELVVVISCSRGWEQKMDYPPADVIVGALIKPIIEEHCGEAADE